jgi:gluconate 2-dehydrogenase subunit 3-like protein
MPDRYPGYDVLSKRHTPSWNEQTRAVIDRRLAIDPDAHSFFDEAEWATLRALCARIVPQPAERVRPVPLAAMIDAKLHENAGDGYRDARLPAMGEAWRRGLAALDAEAMAHDGLHFHALAPDRQDDLVRAMQRGELKHRAWQSMPCDVFFKHRVLSDIVRSYYAHPTAWNEIGWSGPASPRGYVRMDFDRRDEWEAAEAKPRREDEAYRENLRVGR